MNLVSTISNPISLVSKRIFLFSNQASIIPKRISFLTKIVLLICFALNPISGTTAEPVKTPATTATETGKVNINTADANLLAETLKGIGLKKATAIVEYRTTYGPFHDIKELAEVSGIGPATLEKNAHLISVQ